MKVNKSKIFKFGAYIKIARRLGNFWQFLTGESKLPEFHNPIYINIYIHSISILIVGTKTSITFDWVNRFEFCFLQID